MAQQYNGDDRSVSSPCRQTAGQRPKRRTTRMDFFFYVWLFFLLAGFGWLWEGFLYLLKDDMYVSIGLSRHLCNNTSIMMPPIP